MTLNEPRREVSPDLLTPLTRQKYDLFMAKANDALSGFGYQVFPLETRRNQKRQEWLYGAGRTAAELRAAGIDPSFARPTAKTVTWTLQSKHLEGLAFDVWFKDSKGKYTFNAPSGLWNQLIQIGESVGLRNLAPKEYAHFEDNLLPLPAAPKPSMWAAEAVEKAKKKGITRWEDPQQEVGTEVLRQMLFKLGLVTRQYGIITKEDMAVILDRLHLLD